jgi:hypothetical protein
MYEWNEEEDKSYDENGKLTPYGLAMWLDDEGGVCSIIQGRGILDLIEAGVSRDVAKQLEDSIELMHEELERIGAIL